MTLRRSFSRRGSAILFTLFFMILMFGLAAAYCIMVPADLRNALRLKDDTDAFYVADGGVTDALAQMEFQVNTDSKTFEDFRTVGNSFWTVTNGVAPLVAAQPTYQTGFTTAIDARQCVAVKTWAKKLTETMSYQVVLERWDCRRSSQYVPSIFHITSSAIIHRGTPQAKVRRTVEAWARQGSFADYGWWNQPFSGSDLVIALNSFKLDGKYHSNGKIILQQPGDWSGSADWSNIPEYNGLNYRASFLAGITMASPTNATIGSQQVRIDGIDWSGTSASNRPYDSTGAKIAERYNRITEEQTGAGISTTPMQNLPPGAALLSRAALGDTYPATGLTTANSTYAWGTGTGSGNNVQLHVPKGVTGTSGYPPMQAGILVEGDVKSIELSAPGAVNGNGIAASTDGDTNSVMNVTQTVSGNNYSVNITTVYESLTIPASSKVNGTLRGTATNLAYSTNGLGYTVVRKGTSNEYMVYEGVGNGAIYVDGDINSLRGVNRGRKTLATSMDSGTSTTRDGEIRLTGDLLRADALPFKDPSSGATVTPKPTGVRDQLGLVSYAVRLPENKTGVSQAVPQLKNPDGTIPQPTWGTTFTTLASKPFLIYAAIFTGRSDDPKRNSGSSFTAQTSGGGMGTINYSSATREHFRLMGSLTEGLRQAKGVVGTAGFSYDMMYDNKLRQTSPPFFPGSAGFSLTSWMEYPQRRE